MEKLDYSILDDILIEDYDLIIPNYSTVYNYCYKQKIRTLSELILKYKNNEVYTLNRKSIAEIYGFIELVFYRHFHSSILCESLFFDEIKVFEDMWKGNYKKGWNESRVISTKTAFPIRRLGFSNDEENKLKFFVEKKKEDMLIINALFSYKNASNKPIIKGHSKAQEVFEKKIDILLDYYNKIYLPCIESGKINYLLGLLYNYKELLENKKKLDNELESIINKFNEQSSGLDEKYVKNLLRVHGIDDI